MADRLTVYANPYAHLNERGEPAGAFPEDITETLDPRTGTYQRRWVGARVDAERTKIIRPYEPADPARMKAEVFNVQETRFAFDAGPLSILDTPHHRMGVRSGELIAGDAATARRCGAPFIEPDKALADAKERAVAKWAADYGETPSFACNKSMAVDEPAEKGAL